MLLLVPLPLLALDDARVWPNAAVAAHAANANAPTVDAKFIMNLPRKGAVHSVAAPPGFGSSRYDLFAPEGPP